MGNFHYLTSQDNPEESYVVVLMISRNKDNKHLENFKERRKSKFCRFNPERLLKEFETFAEQGQVTEMSRLYVSLNARDPHKVQKQLIHKLIDEEIKFDYLDCIIAGIAAEKQNALEKKWFFDFDSLDKELLDSFVKDVKLCSTLDDVVVNRTPNGYAVIVERGFDTRVLLSVWGDVASLKRDDLICYSWKQKISI